MLEQSREISLNKVSVLIPVLNEGKAIGMVIDELIKEGFQRDKIIVIDGGSVDNTVEEARQRGVVVINQEGRGKADAIKTGLRLVKTPYVLLIDGDYTYPASDAKRVVGMLRGYDEVIGARVNGRHNIPLLNRFGNWLITKVFNALFGTNLLDVCSGLYAVRSRKLRHLGIEANGFNVEVEIAAKIASTTGKIMEVPITYRSRMGTPKLKARVGLSIVKETLKLAWRYNPVFLIFLLGALLMIPGIAIGAWVGYELIFLGVKHHVLGIIAFILSSTGLQCLVVSLLALYLKRLEFRHHRMLDKLIDDVERVKRRLKRSCKF